MKYLKLLVLGCMLLSCKDDDEKFSTAEGTWGYTTSDGKIAVQFDLAKDGSNWIVKNQMIHVEGTMYNAEVTFSGINPPDIEQIRINANDAAAVYAYYITLENATVSSDFNQINVADASYTWPHNKVNTLVNITVVRK